ncbi:hypothetical protein DLAC_01595 [Tieghemostelium lacteum]|uniref:GH16 domain-containing protein n=1 Tax=Tieghemostelium lacteum TaxID=361077 RepID=A0A152A5T4_TIELA|nr:hypothetical protein DLAC_01595 [Tieghemostelium lacteum]|eukprot:KYR01594.1 hypothetical protein DLAC_01595 [Tieghemostelium lacteum]
MKINKFILIFLIITLVIQFIDSASPPPTTPTKSTKPKSTIKPTLSPLVDNSGSNSNSNSIDSDSLEPDTPLSKSKNSTTVLCPKEFKETSFVSQSKYFTIVENAPSYSPYRLCGLTKDAVSFSSNDEMVLTLDNDECPEKCHRKDYSCAQVVSSYQLKYGTFTCVMKASDVAGVISSCFVSNSAKVGMLNEIYFRIPGGKSLIQYGFTSTGVPSGYFKQKQTTFDPLDYNNFTIVLTNRSVSWYANGNKLDEYAGRWDNNPAIPRPPLKFFASIYNDEFKDYVVPAKNLPTSMFISELSYTPGLCPKVEINNSGYSWESTSPLWYFHKNCTYDRVEWIYNDTLDENWQDKSLSMRDFAQDQLIKSGQAAIRFDLTEETTVYFYTNKSWSVNKHNYLSFWINAGETLNPQMIIAMTGVYKGNDNTIVGTFNLGDYIRGGLEKNTWYKVILPLNTMKLIYPEVTHFSGFVFKQAYKQYLGQVFVDDIYFSNGTNCIDEDTSVTYYEKGSLENGATKAGSYGSVDFNSTNELFKSGTNVFKTIEWRIARNNKLIVSFENGTLSTSDYDAILLKILYIPKGSNPYLPDETNYNPNGEKRQTPLEPKAMIAVQVASTPYMGIGLSEYVGGEFPTDTWTTLVIPFFDLSCGAGEGINALQLTSDQDGAGSTIFIAKIQAVKYADPPVLDSFAIKTSQANMLLVILSTLLLLFIL